MGKGVFFLQTEEEVDGGGETFRLVLTRHSSLLCVFVLQKGVARENSHTHTHTFSPFYFSGEFHGHNTLPTP